MLTKKDYCNLEISDELRKLGYPKWPYEAMDMDSRLRIIPLYDAQKWLREEKGIHIEITYTPACWTGKIYDLKKCDYIKGFTFFKSFEETLHTLIKEAIKLLKEEK